MRTALIFTLGSLIGAVIGYRLRPWSDADEAELAEAEATLRRIAEPYRAALGWNATGEALTSGPDALPMAFGYRRKADGRLAKVDCD